jgi:hypothetical protein
MLFEWFILLYIFVELQGNTEELDLFNYRIHGKIWDELSDFFWGKSIVLMKDTICSLLNLKYYELDWTKD